MEEVSENNVTDIDRRLFERIEAKYPMKLNASEAPFSADIYLRDISAGGAKIITKRKLNLYRDVEFWVDIPDGGNPLRLSGKIVWLKNVGKSIWDVGVSFKDIKLMRFHRLLNCATPS